MEGEETGLGGGWVAYYCGSTPFNIRCLTQLRNCVIRRSLGNERKKQSGVRLVGRREGVLSTWQKPLCYHSYAV